MYAHQEVVTAAMPVALTSVIDEVLNHTSPRKYVFTTIHYNFWLQSSHAVKLSFDENKVIKKRFIYE